MNIPRVLFSLVFGLVLALAAPVLIGGCSNHSASDSVQAEDKDEQSYLQERIQKSFDKRPSKKTR
ncbi:MAG: hypothetical protein P4L85_13330 [Paludisphaera borealis]|uniref:hypothetical protein n=1 Tax=Paludisphaera borealis TaxID=1387353 RepID=UPI0028484395|nr:hypothetical protein [Paludisphaera borealis]MDR3620327.1 hypothetical protein [Paludisphaera borealis]